MSGCFCRFRSKASIPLSLTLPHKGGGNSCPRAAIVSLALLLSSCAGVPKPLPEHLPKAQAAWPGVTIEELTAARRFYLQKCGSCHRAYAPSRLSAEKWPAAVEKMVPKAKLNSGEKEIILRFLAAMAP